MRAAGAHRAGRASSAAPAGARCSATCSTKSASPLGAPGQISFGLKMVAPVIMRFGTPEQQRRFLPRIADGSRLVVPGLLRAGRRLRPRVAAHACRARRRPLRRQRPEDLDHAGAARRLDLLPGAHRPRRAQARGHLVPADRHEVARHHGAQDRADRRRARGQRSVLRQRARAGGAAHRRREPGLDLRQVPARPRAHRRRVARRVEGQVPRAAARGARGAG